MIIGIMRVFQNTIVYSPMRFFGTTKGGVSFATSTILLFIGIVLMVLKKINLLGPILIFLGIITIVISIFFSLRMSLLPISLFKSILIFGAIFLGSALIIRGILELIRK